MESRDRFPLLHLNSALLSHNKDREDVLTCSEPLRTHTPYLSFHCPKRPHPILCSIGEAKRLQLLPPSNCDCGIKRKYTVKYKWTRSSLHIVFCTVFHLAPYRSLCIGSCCELLKLNHTTKGSLPDRMLQTQSQPKNPHTPTIYQRVLLATLSERDIFCCMDPP